MEKYLPTYVFNSIYDIDFNTLYEKGKRVILFDLDNTIATYNEIEPTNKHIEFRNKLYDIGFKVYIVSNNNGNRISKFTKKFIINDFLLSAKKPFPNKTNEFLEKKKINKNEVIFIGDQILTDIACANKVGIDSILVKSIDRTSEKWYTKINRLREKTIVKKLVKKNRPNAKDVLDIITK